MIKFHFVSFRLDLDFQLLDSFNSFNSFSSFDALETEVRRQARLLFSVVGRQLVLPHSSGPSKNYSQLTSHGTENVNLACMSKCPCSNSLKLLCYKTACKQPSKRFSMARRRSFSYESCFAQSRSPSCFRTCARTLKSFQMSGPSK